RRAGKQEAPLARGREGASEAPAESDDAEAAEGLLAAARGAPPPLQDGEGREGDTHLRGLALEHDVADVVRPEVSPEQPIELLPLLAAREGDGEVGVEPEHRADRRAACDAVEDGGVAEQPEVAGV